MDPIGKIYLKTIILIMIINLTCMLLVLFLLNPAYSDNVTVYEPVLPVAVAVEPEVLSYIFDIPPIIPETKNVTIEEECELETIYNYVLDICAQYDNVPPELVMSVIWHESRFQVDATNTVHLGLMQVSTKWHQDRADRLNVTDFYDPYSSILLGVDYLSELTTRYTDPSLVLMLYNMNHKTAWALYKEGKTSGYAQSVLERAHIYKEGE